MKKKKRKDLAENVLTAASKTKVTKKLLKISFHLHTLFENYNLSILIEFSKILDSPPLPVRYFFNLEFRFYYSLFQIV